MAVAIQLAFVADLFEITWNKRQKFAISDLTVSCLMLITTSYVFLIITINALY